MEALGHRTGDYVMVDPLQFLRVFLSDHSDAVKFIVHFGEPLLFPVRILGEGLRLSGVENETSHLQ